MMLNLEYQPDVCSYKNNLWACLRGSFSTALSEVGRLTLSLDNTTPWPIVLLGIIWREQIKHQHVSFQSLDSEHRCLVILPRYFTHCDELDTLNCE